MVYIIDLMDVSSSFYTLIYTAYKRVWGREWAITFDPSNWVHMARIRPNTKTCRNGKQKTSVCVCKCWSLTLSQESFAPHLSRFSCSTLLFTNVISTTRALYAKKWEENLSTNTQVAAAGIICRSERESGCTRRMQPNGISVSLSQSRTHTW